MKASEAIKDLQRLIDKHGDHDIFVEAYEAFEGPVPFKIEFFSDMSDDLYWEDDEPDPPELVERYMIMDDI